MSALEALSHAARTALWLSAMDSNVPVQLAEPVTISRVSALLRSTDSKTRDATTRVLPPIASEPARQDAPNGSLMGSDPL